MIILDTIFLELLKTKTSPRPLSHQQNLIQIESAEIHQGLRANRSLFWCDIFFLIRLGGIKTDHGNINLKMSRVTFHNFEDITHFKVTESSYWCIHQNYCVFAVNWWQQWWHQSVQILQRTVFVELLLKKWRRESLPYHCVIYWFNCTISLTSSQPHTQPHICGDLLQALCISCCQALCTSALASCEFDSHYWRCRSTSILLFQTYQRCKEAAP